MSDDSPRVQIEINADAKTGAIDLTAGQFEHLGAVATELAGPLAALATAAGVAEFLQEASKAAEENAQSLAHMRAQISAAGLDLESSTKTAVEWAEALQQTSRFGAPELESALSKVITKTGDLALSQKLVQLAMNVNVATGRDFSTELDNLALAAGGSARGVNVLQKELGQQAVGINDVNVLLNMLASRYRDNATQSHTLTDAAAQQKNTFHEMAAIVGNSLNPALQGLYGVAQTLEKAFGTLWSLLSLGAKDTAAEVNAMLLTIVSLSVQTARVLKDVATLNFKDISEAAKQGATERRIIEEDARKTEKAAAEQANRELIALGSRKADAEKGTIKEVSDFKGLSNKTDLQEEIVTTQAEISNVKIGEEIKLAQKNQSSLQRLASLQSALDEELAILDRHHGAWLGKEAQFQAERTKLVNENNLKRAQIENKYIQDRVAATEAWAAQHRDIMANMEAAERQMIDALATGFANAVAQSIVEGKNLEDALKKLAIQITEQIIADLIRIAIQAEITKAAVYGIL